MRTRRTLRGHLAKIYALHWATDSRYTKSNLLSNPQSNVGNILFGMPAWMSTAHTTCVVIEI
jgi:hypothetical protein